jgi:hypothetical protein
MIRIAPVPSRFLKTVRALGVDDQGQNVKRIVASGGEPCRDVLRRALPGEELILASFTPFMKAGPYKEYGPIFVLANDTEENVSRDRLPTDGYLREQFVIRAYSEAEEIVDASLLRPTEAEATIERFFDSPETAFLHVRFPAYGCFALRIDRENASHCPSPRG